MTPHNPACDVRDDLLIRSVKTHFSILTIHHCSVHPEGSDLNGEPKYITAIQPLNIPGGSGVLRAPEIPRDAKDWVHHPAVNPGIPLP
ncbi:hypothetical protein NPIL_540481 [Nephila pilipes]|uniref:Uncharacterized protein n=1 Tax=Nephila pilipes TaxID=299642 RepID=A0A8X6PTK6_NEPPI|nr:hypothetical protein NPIL_540481 [Nephila pilipes]